MIKGMEKDKNFIMVLVFTMGNIIMAKETDTDLNITFMVN